MPSWVRRLTGARPEEAAPQDGERHKVLVYENEARNVANLTLQYPDIETGGSLFGYWTHGGSPIVAFASGPGLRSTHNATSFYQEEAYLHDLGTTLYDRHGLQHIGEWHSHHQLGLNRPSGGDVRTIRLGMQQKSWARFLLLISTIKNVAEGVVLKNYFLFTDEREDPEPLRILLLPGKSPFRTGEFLDREEPTLLVEQMAWGPGPYTPEPSRQAAEEVYPGAWFTTADARERLAKIQGDFRRIGIECRIRPDEDGRHLELELGETRLVLGPEFPREAPRWTGAGQPPKRGEWDESTDLVAWFRRAGTTTPEKATPERNEREANDAADET